MIKDKIVVVEYYDHYDCDTCGYNDATGFKIVFPDGTHKELKASASCFGSDSYNYAHLLSEILKYYKIETEVEYTYE